MNLTTKQKAILALIVVGNDTTPPTPIDFDQLIDRLPYMPSKDSMHFSIRALVNKGLVEKGGLEIRRERKRRLILPTALGQHWSKLLCPRPLPMNIEEAMDLGDLEALEKSLGLDVSSLTATHSNKDK